MIEWQLVVLGWHMVHAYCAQVLRAGVLCEYGEPYELLCNPNSYLLRLVEHTGAVAAQKLKNMARSAYEERYTGMISTV